MKLKLTDPILKLIFIIYRYLIEKGADTNVEDINGNTALMIAALHAKNIEIIKVRIFWEGHIFFKKSPTLAD